LEQGKGKDQKGCLFLKKGCLSESVLNLKSREDRFNGRVSVFEELAQKEISGVKSLVVYGELTAEIGTIK
jgi:hypothetical protein